MKQTQPPIVGYLNLRVVAVRMRERGVKRVRKDGERGK